MSYLKRDRGESVEHVSTEVSDHDALSTKLGAGQSEGGIARCQGIFLSKR
jgi:hypothetical protein